MRCMPPDLTAPAMREVIAVMCEIAWNSDNTPTVYRHTEETQLDRAESLQHPDTLRFQDSDAQIDRFEHFRHSTSRP